MGYFVNRWILGAACPEDIVSSKLVAVVSRRGVSISDSIELKQKKGISFLQKIIFFNSNRYIDTGTIKTFRDLTIRILNKSGELRA